MSKGVKKYTSPDRCKKYYEENKEKLLTKMKESPIPSEKRKEYNKKYYLKKKRQKLVMVFQANVIKINIFI
jgi:hypothetical protein